MSLFSTDVGRFRSRRNLNKSSSLNFSVSYKKYVSVSLFFTVLTTFSTFNTHWYNWTRIIMCELSRLFELSGHTVLQIWHHFWSFCKWFTTLSKKWMVGIWIVAIYVVLTNMCYYFYEALTSLEWPFTCQWYDLRLATIWPAVTTYWYYGYIKICFSTPGLSVTFRTTAQIQTIADHCYNWSQLKVSVSLAFRFFE